MLVCRPHSRFWRLFVVYGIPALLMQAMLPADPVAHVAPCSRYADWDFDTPSFREEGSWHIPVNQLFLGFSTPELACVEEPPRRAEACPLSPERECPRAPVVACRAHSPPKPA